jgi:hypothetical protein
MITSNHYETKVMKIRNNTKVTLHGLGPSQTIDIEMRDGLAVSRVWRNRLRDSRIDNCVEIIKTLKTKGMK